MTTVSAIQTRHGLGDQLLQKTTIEAAQPHLYAGPVAAKRYSLFVPMRPGFIKQGIGQGAVCADHPPPGHRTAGQAHDLAHLARPDSQYQRQIAV